MATLMRVILSYGGRIAMPLSVWCGICLVLFCVACCGAFKVDRVKFWGRFIVGCIFPVLWVVHMLVVLYTICQCYYLLWLVPWHQASMPSAANRFDALVVCSFISMLASVQLLSACLIALWDLSRYSGQASRACADKPTEAWPLVKGGRAP